MKSGPEGHIRPMLAIAEGPVILPAKMEIKSGGHFYSVPKLEQIEGALKDIHGSTAQIVFLHIEANLGSDATVYTLLTPASLIAGSHLGLVNTAN